jgi:predicted RNase H-like HicB family nuclease
MKPNDITTDGLPCYVLSVNGLSGCMAQGNTLGEATRELKEVIDEWVLILIEQGEVDPKDIVKVEINQ